MSPELRLDESVTAAFPHAQTWFVVVDGLDNRSTWGELEREVAALEESVAAGSFRPLDETHPAIRSWFDAYRQFGTNPKRCRPSVNALCRRLGRSGRLPRISPAVDAYNLVSIRRGLPAGAFDLASISGPVEIRHARTGDTFTPLGEPGITEQPRPGEVVYAQGAMTLTRHWNHRDADRTKVTKASAAAVFLVERVAEVVPEANLAAAVDELVRVLQPHVTSLRTGRVWREQAAAPLASAGGRAGP